MQKIFIFDVDGVLFDSEKLYMDMNQAWFKELGIKLSAEEHHRFIGISAKIFWQQLKTNNMLPESIEYYIETEKQMKYKMLLEQEIQPTAGVVEFLQWLKRGGFGISIASSGMRKNINLILEKLGIGSYFDYIVSGGDITRGKPEPDIFLKAAEYYGIEANHCMVIEDSANGVMAAKSAGMKCIGYYNPNSGNQDLSSADIIIDDFRTA
ncbi:MAG: HAD family phosphatase, partial [Bacteroidetes bacterium]|nr:HAD family phosphatase [Bacteroidota bacterium]